MYVSQVHSSMGTLLKDFLFLEINSLLAIDSGSMIGQTIQYFIMFIFLSQKHILNLHSVAFGILKYLKI